MPIYEYECNKCGNVTAFQEKMFRQPSLWELLFKKKKCGKCGSKDLKKIVSTFSGKVERTYNETLNELKSMGNVQFVPQSGKTAPSGPPPGGCPYEKQFRKEQEKADREKAEKKAREPIEVR